MGYGESLGDRSNEHILGDERSVTGTYNATMTAENMDYLLITSSQYLKIEDGSCVVRARRASSEHIVTLVSIGHDLEEACL